MSWPPRHRQPPRSLPRNSGRPGSMSSLCRPAVARRNVWRLPIYTTLLRPSSPFPRIARGAVDEVSRQAREGRSAPAGPSWPTRRSRWPSWAVGRRRLRGPRRIARRSPRGPHARRTGEPISRRLQAASTWLHARLRHERGGDLHSAPAWRRRAVYRGAACCGPSATCRPRPSTCCSPTST